MKTAPESPSPGPLEPQSRSALEVDAATVRGHLQLAATKIVEHFETLHQQPASDRSEGVTTARAAEESWPPTVSDLPSLLDELFDRLAPTSFNNPGPGFLAYVPGGGLFHSALADLLAGCLNRYVTVWAAAPGLVQLEINVIRWFCSMVGYPAEAGGFLSSGGSIANLSALVSARRDRLPEDFRHGTVYISDQTHHSVAKAALIAGLPQANVRRLPVDKNFRIDLQALGKTIDRDRADGFQPFLLVGNAGTTNSGAIDPLDELATLAEHQDLWFHVDAAYGGFFCLTHRGRRRLHGIERADSITLDPHKGLFLPYGTGCLLVRDPEKLRQAHSVAADYMPPIQGDAQRVDFSEISPELSRSFRGLRVWLPLKLHGVAPFEAALDEKLDLAEWMASRLSEVDGIKIIAPPQLSTLAFRLDRNDLDAEECDRLNQRLLAHINDSRRVLLTPTRLDGRFVIRICVLNFRTHRDRMEACLEDIRSAIDRVSAG